MDKERNEEIELFVEKLKKEINIEEFILFGSRARGDNLENSDVDLIIVSKDFRGIPFFERMDKLILLWDSPLDLEVLCYTPEEFEEKKKEIGIVREALKDGIEL
ncbi:MAG: nucleotidyltransferase domain-containing protein [Candidatus Methanofastidiosia archaeon]